MNLSREEIKSLSIEASRQDKIIKDKDTLISDLKRKIVMFESEKLELLDDRAKLAKLYDMGLINSAGDPILVEVPEDDEGANKEEFMKF